VFTRKGPGAWWSNSFKSDMMYIIGANGRFKNYRDLIATKCLNSASFVPTNEILEMTFGPVEQQLREYRNEVIGHAFSRLWEANAA